MLVLVLSCCVCYYRLEKSQIGEMIEDGAEADVGSQNGENKEGENKEGEGAT